MWRGSGKPWWMKNYALCKLPTRDQESAASAMTWISEWNPWYSFGAGESSVVLNHIAQAENLSLAWEEGNNQSTPNREKGESKVDFSCTGYGNLRCRKPWACAGSLVFFLLTKQQFNPTEVKSATCTFATVERCAPLTTRPVHISGSWELEEWGYLNFKFTMSTFSLIKL